MKGRLDDNDMIVTVGEKRGAMPRAYYEKLSTFIVETLESQEAVPFLALLEQAEQNFSGELRGNLSWYLLYVKQDLQARKVIKTELEHNRQQWIRLTKKYKERIRNIRLDKVIQSE